MISSDTLFGYTHCTIPFTVKTDASDKHFCTIISNDNKIIEFLPSILSKPERNYNTTEKEILTIVEWLKKFWVILFGYEIKIFAYH